MSGVAYSVCISGSSSCSSQSRSCRRPTMPQNSSFSGSNSRAKYRMVASTVSPCSIWNASLLCSCSKSNAASRVSTSIEFRHGVASLFLRAARVAQNEFALEQNGTRSVSIAHAKSDPNETMQVPFCPPLGMRAGKSSIKPNYRQSPGGASAWHDKGSPFARRTRHGTLQLRQGQACASGKSPCRRFARCSLPA